MGLGDHLQRVVIDRLKGKWGGGGGRGDLNLSQENSHSHPQRGEGRGGGGRPAGLDACQVRVRGSWWATAVCGGAPHGAS